jgi:hypothetical protein
LGNFRHDFAIFESDADHLLAVLCVKLTAIYGESPGSHVLADPFLLNARGRKTTADHLPPLSATQCPQEVVAQAPASAHSPGEAMTASAGASAGTSLAAAEQDETAGVSAAYVPATGRPRARTTNVVNRLIEASPVFARQRFKNQQSNPTASALL